MPHNAPSNGAAVVVPVFNRQITIRATLDSVAAQTSPPQSLIIVDDGSTDGSAEIAERWIAERRPAFAAAVVRVPHRGASAARNTGLEAAGGAEFVAFLDSDDRWPRDFLSRAQAALASVREAVAASTDRQFDGRGVTTHTGGLESSAAEWLLEHDAGIGSATLLRTRVVHELGGYPAHLLTGADLALFLRLAMRGRWLHLPGAPVFFGRPDVERGESNHLSGTFVDRGRIWGEILEDALAELGVDPGFPRETCLRAIGHAYARAHRELTQAGRQTEALACLDRGASIRFPSGIAVSIVVEWENVLLSEMDRCREMLRRVGDQVRSLASRQNELHGVLRRLRFPVEIVVVFDPEHVDSALIEQVIREEVPADVPVACRLEQAPGRAYYGLKNHGAAAAAGDIVVFIDSDVIPEAGWLERILASFDDGRVRLVGGNTFLEAETTYSKAMAAGWFFPLRTTQSRLQRAPRFFANNFAADRELLLDHPFRNIPGQARGACARLARELRQSGVAPYLNLGAQVTHPPPSGVKHFLLRALAEGRDQRVEETDGSAGPHVKAAVLGTPARRALQALRRLRQHRRDLRISLGELPLAATVLAVYYGTFSLGYLLTRVAPRPMRRRLWI